MACREVWTAKELRELLVQRAGLELSKQSISDLINKPPVQVKVRTLEALCTTLRCTPNELFGVDTPREVSIAAESDSGDSRVGQ
jgi:DNA-binding Xre family transcriptional regulator